MIEFIQENDSDTFVEAIEFLEEEIRQTLTESECDLDSNSKAKRQVAVLVEKTIGEYTKYIKHSIEINPFCLKEIKQLRSGRQFWIEWREENLGQGLPSPSCDSRDIL